MNLLKMCRPAWNHLRSPAFVLLVAFHISSALVASSDTNTPTVEALHGGSSKNLYIKDVLLPLKSNLLSNVTEYLKTVFNKLTAQSYTETPQADVNDIFFLAHKMVDWAKPWYKKIKSLFNVHEWPDMPFLRSESRPKTVHDSFITGLSHSLPNAGRLQPYPTKSNLISQNANTDRKRHVIENIIKPNFRFARNAPTENNEINEAGFADRGTITQRGEALNSSAGLPEVTTQISNVIKRDPLAHDLFHGSSLTETEPSVLNVGAATLKDGNIDANISSATQTPDPADHFSSVNDDADSEDTPSKASTRDVTLKETLQASDNNYETNVSLSQNHMTDDDDNDNISKARTKEFSSNDTFIKISLLHSGDSMRVTWLFASNDTRITGFQVSYRVNKRENYDSSNLDLNVRSFTLHSLHEDEDYVICVHVMLNNTAVKDSCAEWSRSSMKIVVGILAGSIFLLPCIAIIVLILHKDRQIKKKRAADVENDDNVRCKEQLLSAKKSAHAHFRGLNIQATDKIYTGVQDTTLPQSYSSKSLHDTGHENPCPHTADDTTDDDNIDGPWKRLSKQDEAHIQVFTVLGQPPLESSASMSQINEQL